MKIKNLLFEDSSEESKSYVSLLSDTTKSAIAKNPALKEKVDNGVLDSSIVKNLLDSQTVENILKDSLYNNLNDRIQFELWGRYFALLGFPTEGDEGTFLISKIAADGPGRVFAGNSPYFEFIQNIGRGVKPDYDILKTIDALIKSRDITNLDMKSKQSWLYNENLWKGKPAEIIYKLKLHVMLEDKEALEKFQDSNGLPLKDLIAQDEEIKKLFTWETAIQNPVAELRKYYSKYNSDNYDAKERQKSKEDNGKIYFREFIKEIIDKSEGKWDNKNYLSNLKSLLKTNALLDSTLEDNLNSAFRDEVERNSLLRWKVKKSLDILNNKEHLKEFVSELKIYFKDNLDLSSNVKVPAQKIKFKPGAFYTVKDALNALGVTVGNVKGFFNSKVLAHQNKNPNGYDYIPAFNKLFDTKANIKNLMDAKIKANSKGSFNWTQFILKYLMDFA